MSPEYRAGPERQSSTSREIKNTAGDGMRGRDRNAELGRREQGDGKRDRSENGRF